VGLNGAIIEFEEDVKVIFIMKAHKGEIFAVINFHPDLFL
jgi:hypothetical protein